MWSILLKWVFSLCVLILVAVGTRREMGLPLGIGKKMMLPLLSKKSGGSMGSTVLYFGAGQWEQSHVSSTAKC